MSSEVWDVFHFFWTLLRHCGFDFWHFVEHLFDIANELRMVGAL